MAELTKWPKWTSPAVRRVRILHAKSFALKRIHQFLGFLPHMHNLNIIMRKHHTNPNWEAVSKTTGQQLPKVPKLWQTRKEGRQWKSYNEQMQVVLLIVSWNRKKTLKGNGWEETNVCSLVNSIISILISLVGELYIYIHVLCVSSEH